MQYFLETQHEFYIYQCVIVHGSQTCPFHWLFTYIFRPCNVYP